MPYHPQAPTPSRPPSSSIFDGYGCLLGSLLLCGLGFMLLAAPSQLHANGLEGIGYAVYILMGSVVLVVGIPVLGAAVIWKALRAAETWHAKSAAKKASENLTLPQKKRRKNHTARRPTANF